ncbi:hypothetical protein AB0D33_27370 [Streptomyces sp. NPDC048404]|uniref:hypothetical protein n=1 Tax=unclassified Streptomyces TaxID=2593676 RepID=UPI0034443312
MRITRLGRRATPEDTSEVLRPRQVTDRDASADAEPLYAALGFVREPDPSMRPCLRAA